MKIPMMPKGVEHLKPKRKSAAFTKVKIPMMPKGVEHLQVRDYDNLATREDSNDAERR